MIISNYNILPLTNDKLFEQFVCDFFNELHNTNSFQLYGTSGQNQNGIDIISFEKEIVIQCKAKNIARLDNKIRQELESGLISDLNKFLEYKKKKAHSLNKFVFATTWRNDTHLIDKCNELSKEKAICVEYWSWDRLTENLSESLFKKYFSYFKKLNKNYYKSSDEISVVCSINVDRSKPILNQTYDYLSQKFDDINVLPSNMFIGEYPFKNEKRDSFYRQDFTLHIVNEELVRLFKSFKIEDDTLVNNFDTDNSFKKANFIVKTLTQNHIFNVQGNTADTFKTIRVLNKNEKNKKLDIFERFKFAEVYGSLSKIEETNLEANLELGYFYYKIGDLLVSKDYFLKAKDIAEKENKEISFLICNHNLYHLGRLIDFRFWDLDNKKHIVSSLKDHNIEEIKVRKVNEPIKKLLLNNAFFLNAQNAIRQRKEKIVEKYFSYLRGGRSSSNFDWNILYEYATLHAFLNKNYVIFDVYSDYENVIHDLIESVFASYSIRNGQDRVVRIDDYLLNHIILYAQTVEIEKYIKRFYLYKLEYTATSNEGDDFVTLFNNFLGNDFLQFKNALNNVCAEARDKFWNQSSRYFNNMILLLGILDFDKNKTNQLAKKTIKHIENCLNYFKSGHANLTNKYVYQFFIRKHKLIDSTVLKQLILFAYKKENFYLVEYFEDLSHQLRETERKLNFTENQFRNIILPFVKGKLDSRKFSNYDDNVLYLYDLLNESQQEHISNLYLNELDKQFDYNLYYLLVIYNIIEINYNDNLNKFLGTINISEEKSVNRDIFNEPPKYNRYAKLDSLANMCFKCDINLQEPRFSKFKKTNSYYRWLFDIDNYNYKKEFDPYWISEYQTKFYKEHFKKSKILKSNVLKSLQNNFDIKLEKIFLNTFSV
ncbi:hypothetical protein [Aquimarina sp. AU474]|uniref:hypothetical protein n=1 Tax=Aquimarina sp. AU474 TaxID=2108529 RepID=UPI000D694E70|nr:hypothetical protein [Aquimarina sp. AU474]